jgi:hypothetical protein
MLYEAYKVAVQLSIVDKVSPFLRAFSGQLQAAGKDADVLQKKIEGIGKLAKAGGALMLGGVGMLASLKGPVDEAIKYQNALTRFKQMNLGDAVNKDADAMARHANAFGNSATQMMNTIRDLHAAFGSYEEAKHFAPMIAQLNAANSAIYGEGHGIDESETKALAKVIEMRGGTVNQAAFMRELDLMQRMKNATGGVLDATTLRAFMSTAGIAGRSLSDQGLMKMSGLIMEMGGNRAGTALMSMYQNLVAGRTTKKAMSEIAALGLGEIAEVHSGHVGGSKKTTTILKNVKGEDQLRNDPVGWIGNVLLPQLASKGITSQNDILKIINDILSNRTGANQASITATQLGVVLKDATNAINAKGVSGTIDDARGTASGRLADFHAKLSTLGQVIGENVLPVLTPLISGLTDLAREAAKHPIILRVLTAGFIGLAAAMSFGGTIMLLTAGFKGLGVAMEIAGPLLGVKKGLDGVGVAAEELSVGGKIAGAIGGIGKLIFWIGRIGSVIGLAIGAWNLGQWAGKEFSQWMDERKKKQQEEYNKKLGIMAGYNQNVGQGPTKAALDTLNKQHALAKKLSDGLVDARANTQNAGQYQFKTPVDAKGMLNSTLLNTLTTNQNSQTPTREVTPYVAPPRPQEINLNVQGKVNERVLLDIVSNGIAKNASRGLGTGGFDSGLNMPLVAQN